MQQNKLFAVMVYISQASFKSSQYYLYSSISEITNLPQGVLQSVQDPFLDPQIG